MTKATRCYRFVVCVDVSATSLTAAYTKLYDKMASTALGWETSDEAYDPDGKAYSTAALQKAIDKHFSRVDRKKKGKAK